MVLHREAMVPTVVIVFLRIISLVTKLMKKLHMKKSPFVALIQSLVLSCALLVPSLSHADEKVMLNFSNADIESTIRAVGLIANKNFVIFLLFLLSEISNATTIRYCVSPIMLLTYLDRNGL